MAMEFDPRGWNRRPVYLSVTGVITQMQMMSANGSGYGGGTPAGAGMGFDPPRFLKPGDVVCCSIEKIGKINNPVV